MRFDFEWDFDSVVAICSIVVPLLAFVWEFVVVRRKRLGYRVQMDRLATDTAHAPNADVLARMHENGRELTEPSFVLLRIENAGWTEIVESDYLTPEHDRTGIRVKFRDRRVVGMAVTELSQPELRDFFITHADGVTAEAEGFGIGDRITFTDGQAEGKHTRILARPVAYSMFTLVVHKVPGVENLSLQQIRDIYAGKITNWSELRGPSVPIHLINRNRGSGTRTALEERVLNGKDLLGATVNDCAALEKDKPGICEVDNTQTLLRAVAEIPGALGYSKVNSAATSRNVVQVQIDNKPATLEGVEDGKYPYWQTEFAYTYGEPPVGSIAAAFLRYLTDQGGKDILREFGNRPCSETEYPLICEPT